MSEADSQGNAAAGPSLSHSRSTTPKPNPAVAEAQLQSITSTPRTARSDGKWEKITDLRVEIAYQMDGEFVECPATEFVQHYLPFEPKDADVNALITKATYSVESPAEPVLPPNTDATRAARSSAAATTPVLPQRRKDQILEKVGDDLKFIDYHELDITPGEAVAYRELETIMKAIGQATITRRPRNGFRYHACPDTTIKSETPGSNNRIDACIISDDCFANEESKVDLRTNGIAVAFEFKLKPEKTIENNVQVVSANVQLMNDDVRRMFTYGVTIVGEMVRLWYHGHSHSAVSEPFSFIKNPKLFVKAMMSFLFATELELGYDPTITRLPNNRLLFTMADDQGNPVYYRTVRTLSEFRSCNITGRMSRVWDVEQVSKSDGSGHVISHAVLKDVWLDDNAPTEREIQEAIYKAIEDRKPAIDSNECIQALEDEIIDDMKKLVEDEQYKKYFLTIITDSKGQLSKDVAHGARRIRNLLLPVLPPAQASTSTANAERVASNTPQPTQREEDYAAREKTAPRDWNRKRRYHVAYEEKCVTVGNIETVGEVFNVLAQTLAALRLLYFAGWVHRDISTGNVMAYKSSPDSKWQAKLCDLEYAKEYDIDPSATSKDPKTGTPYFMANEILGNYPMLPTLGEEDNSSPGQQEKATNNDAESKKKKLALRFSSLLADVNNTYANSAAVKAKAKTKKPALTVIPNFQHDLESIWWIAIYTVTARVEHPPSNDFAKKIFRHTTHLVIERSRCLTELLKDTLVEYLHDNLAGLAAGLEHMRKNLLKNYRSRNRNRLLNGTAVTDDAKSYAAIHNEFWLAFAVLAVAMEKEEVGGFTLITKKRHAQIMTVPQPRKRPRSIRDDDDWRPREGVEEEDNEEEDEPKKKDKKKKKKAKTSHKKTTDAGK